MYVTLNFPTVKIHTDSSGFLPGTVLAEHVVDVLQLFGLVLKVSAIYDSGCDSNAFLLCHDKM